MSNAEYFSRPFPLLTKLAAMLRILAPVRKAFVRFGTLLRSSKKSDGPLVSGFVGEIPEAADEAPEVADEASEAPDETLGITDEAPEATGEILGVTNEAPEIADETTDLTETSNPLAMAPAVSAEAPLAPECSLSTREQLIRRRWAETGIKMWAGQGALNIQGSAELLPAKLGGTRREYDRLEFRMIAGDIVCEGVVVGPPKDRK
jgi:hypothetical protein